MWPRITLMVLINTSVVLLLIYPGTSTLSLDFYIKKPIYMGFSLGYDVIYQFLLWVLYYERNQHINHSNQGCFQIFLDIWHIIESLNQFFHVFSFKNISPLHNNWYRTLSVLNPKIISHLVVKFTNLDLITFSMIIFLLLFALYLCEYQNIVGTS